MIPKGYFISLDAAASRKHLNTGVCGFAQCFAVRRMDIVRGSRQGYAGVLDTI